MRFLLRTTVVWGVLGTGIALAMTQVRSALDAWWSLAGILSGGMLGLFLLGIMVPKSKGKAALPATLIGVTLILWMSLSPALPWWPESLRSPFHNFLVIVFGTAAILLTGFILTVLMTHERRR
jgi:SSS family solute:Na+ symporter